MDIGKYLPFNKRSTFWEFEGEQIVIEYDEENNSYDIMYNDGEEEYLMHSSTEKSRAKQYAKGFCTCIEEGTMNDLLAKDAQPHHEFK